MRWRRAIVAVVVGTVVAVGLSSYGFGAYHMGAVRELTAWMMPRSVSHSRWGIIVYVLTFTLIVAPAAVVAVLVYGLGKPFTDTETRCRNCGYILRGLTEPRCPECSERI